MAVLEDNIHRRGFIGPGTVYVHANPIAVIIDGSVVLDVTCSIHCTKIFERSIVDQSRAVEYSQSGTVRYGQSGAGRDFYFAGKIGAAVHHTRLVLEYHTCVFHNRAVLRTVSPRANGLCRVHSCAARGEQNHIAVYGDLTAIPRCLVETPPPPTPAPE